MTGPKSPQSQAVASVPETRRRRRITAFFRLSLILDTDWTWPEISATIIITSIPPLRLLCWSLKMMLTRPVCRSHVELCFCVCMRSYPTIWNSAVWKCEAVRRSVAPVGEGVGDWCHSCVTCVSPVWSHGHTGHWRHQLEYTHNDTFMTFFLEININPYDLARNFICIDSYFFVDIVIINSPVSTS